MSQPGRWLTGTRGAERIVKLSAELNRKNLERARASSACELSIYRPWMSSHDRLALFAPSDFAKAVSANGARIITDEGFLRFLNEAFASSSELHLGFLGIAEANGLCVEIEDRPRVARIGRMVPDALAWIREVDESFAARVDELIKEVIPLGMRAPLTARSPLGRGVSSHFYRGGILVDLPEIGEHLEVELAVNLAHELGHQALMIYQNADPIIDGDLRAPVYSAIRRETRPAIKSFHAIVALAYMKEFTTEALRSAHTPEDRRPRLTLRVEQIDGDLRLGTRALRDAGVRFTELGCELFEECEAMGSAR